MSELNDMLSTLAGERPERYPYCPMGHWNIHACRKLLPPECFDNNLYSLPETAFSEAPRSPVSRRTAVSYARFLQVSTLGCGKGGALPFGHGGPGEIVWHGVTGLKIDPHPESVVWGVGNIFRDFEAARWMGRNGRQAAETVFTWGRIAEQTVGVYSSI